MTHQFVSPDQENDPLERIINAFQAEIYNSASAEEQEILLAWLQGFLDNPTKKRLKESLKNPTFQSIAKLVADVYMNESSEFRQATEALINANPVQNLPPLTEESQDQPRRRRRQISPAGLNGKTLIIAVIVMLILALVAGGLYFFVIKDEGSVTNSQQETVVVNPTFPPIVTNPPLGSVPETQAESGSSLFAPAQTNCEYLVEQRLPVDANVMLFDSLDFTQKPTIGPQPYIHHYVYKIDGVDAFIVAYDNKVAFAPTSSFPSPGTEMCAGPKVTVLLDQGTQMLAAKIELTNLLASPFGPLVTGAIIALVIAGLSEAIPLKRWANAALFIASMYLLNQITPQLTSLSAQDEMTLNKFLLIIGLIISIGLGGRSIALVIRETFERTMAASTLSQEVNDLTRFDRGLRGLFDHYDWSFLSIFGGLQLALSLTWFGSITTNLWGFWGIVASLAIANIGLIFEALRRNSLIDWILYLCCLGGGILLGIVAMLIPHGTKDQTIGVLVLFVLLMAVLIGAGLNKNTPVSRDQIPEGLLNIIINFLGTIAVAIHFFSDFGGLNF